MLPSLQTIFIFFIYLNFVGVVVTLVGRWSLKVISTDYGDNFDLSWCVGLAVLGGLGYLSFWSSLASPDMANSLRMFLLIGATLYTLANWRKFRDLWKNDSVYMMFLVGVFYISVLYIFGPSSKTFTINERFGWMPGDNWLPMQAANILREGAPLVPFHGEWTMSDRPLLQLGLYLLFSWNKVPLYYETFGMLLQLTWIPAISFVMNQLKVKGNARITIIMFLALNNFLMFNSLYMWPKLLSAGLGLCSLGLLIDSKQSLKGIVMAGFLFAAATQSHGGVVFSAPIFALVMLWYWPFKRLGLQLSVFSLPFIVWHGSWTIFQKVVDPWGDSLVVMRVLGGGIDRSISLLENLMQFYQGLSLTEILAVRLNNLEMLYSPLSFFPDNPSVDFFHLLNVILPILVGLPFVLISIRQIRFMEQKFILLLGAVFSIFLWIAILANPNTASNHHNSYLSILVIILVPAILVVEKAPRLVLGIVFCLQTIRLFSGMISFDVDQDSQISIFNLGVMLLSIGLLILHYFRRHPKAISAPI